jgi:hypothetical protein
LILADSYQLVRLETDIARTIPDIGLRRQHEVIEFSPIQFSHAKTIMLPSVADIYMDLKNHRFFRRHSYTNFQLFSVNVYERLGKARE